jgi:hypothetical protein
LSKFLEKYADEFEVGKGALFGETKNKTWASHGPKIYKDNKP